MPARSSSTPIIITIVAVVVVLLLGGGVTTAVLLHKASSDISDASGGLGGSPNGHSSGGPSGPVYHKLPACDAFSAPVVNTLVPKGSKTTDDQDSDDEHYETSECEWDNIDADDKQPVEDRDVDINVYAYSDDLKPAVEAAQDGLSDDQSQATQLSGTTQDDITYGSLSMVSGLGSGAFAQSFTIKDDLAPSGGTELAMRVGNVLLEIGINGDDGDDGPEGQGKPMDPDEANQAAQKLGNAALDWLKSCTDCTG